jgi:hypothetical protein
MRGVAFIPKEQLLPCMPHSVGPTSELGGCSLARIYYYNIFIVGNNFITIIILFTNVTYFI